MNLETLFLNNFNSLPEFHCIAGGRFEVLGNHTDHNHGLCIAATCNLAITCLFSSNKTNEVTMYSEGYNPIKVDLNHLDQVNDEASTSSGLIRGIARYFKKHGYQIGGFNAVSTSNIFPGAGVSSSAAFESLIGQIFNFLFNDNKIDKLDIAKAGQYAENTDFGKKSGLLDQIGCGYGNLSFIDFKDIDHPLVEEIHYPFKDLHFVIVNTGGSHANLSSYYSSIPMDMWSAAKKLGHDYLIDCEKADDPNLTEIERNRAKHFFTECERVKKMKECIEQNDEQGFLNLINESRLSSTNYLKNMMVDDNYEGSPLEATDLAMKILQNDGACKINGGGFAGSIICVVKEFKLNSFIKAMSEKYGSNNVCEVNVNPNGPLITKYIKLNN